MDLKSGRLGCQLSWRFFPHRSLRTSPIFLDRMTYIHFLISLAREHISRLCNIFHPDFSAIWLYYKSRTLRPSRRRQSGSTMSEVKEEEKQPPSSSGGGTTDRNDNPKELATLTSLATLNLLHQQATLLRTHRTNTAAHATPCLGQPIHIPLFQTQHSNLRFTPLPFPPLTSATSRAEQFGSNAQIANNLLKDFALNHRKLTGSPISSPFS